jgi:predicted transporter
MVYVLDVAFRLALLFMLGEFMGHRPHRSNMCSVCKLIGFEHSLGMFVLPKYMKTMSFNLVSSHLTLRSCIGSNVLHTNG